MTGTRDALDAPAIDSPASALLSSRFVRFLCVGGLNTLFGYASFVLALWLGANAMLALLIATVLGMLFNFQTSRRLVFGSGGHNLLPPFVAVQGTTLALNAIALHLLVSLGVAPWLAQALLILPLAATGYLAQRNLVFADRAAASWALRLPATNRTIFAVGSALFLLPNALLALQLRGAPGALLLAGTLGAAAFVATRSAGNATALLDREIDARRLGICALVALAVLLLGGEAHVFFTNWDWLWRDGVLADLAHVPFPPNYAVGNETFVLRAPLGMYMLPALVAKAAGLGLGHAALLVQNAVLLSCVLYMLALLAGRSAVLMIAIFLSFSGLDIIGQLVRSAELGTPTAAFYPPAHIESWTIFQYSSTITQLFWVPNHALPAYWVALVALLCVLGELTIADFGLALTAALFWSPFAVIGGLPFAAYVFLRSARASLGSTRLWLASATALCFLPVVFYMKADAAEVPHGVLPLGFVLVALQFLALEIPHVFVVREAWPCLDRRIKGLTLVAIAGLVGLPTMQIGVANDLVMRASIPALTILAFVFAQSLDLAWPKRRGVCLFAFALVAIGTVTPAMEVVRALVTPRFAISDCGFATVWKTLRPETDVSNYLARAEAMPTWIARSTPLSADATRACWPDLPHEETISPGDRFKRMMRDWGDRHAH